MSRRASLFGSSRWTWRALLSTRLWSDSARLPKASICWSDRTSTGSSAYCREQSHRQHRYLPGPCLALAQMRLMLLEAYEQVGRRGGVECQRYDAERVTLQEPTCSTEWS